MNSQGVCDVRAVRQALASDYLHLSVEEEMNPDELFDEIGDANVEIEPVIKRGVIVGKGTS